MSEPTFTAPETPPQLAPRPFASEPAEPRVGGCGKPVLVGCGVVFLLLGMVGIGVVLKAKDLLAWSLEQAKPAVIANLGADVELADRERFENAFAGALARIRAGKIDPEALQRVQAELMTTVGQRAAGKIPRATFLALIEAFERLGGEATPAAPEPVVPEAPEAPEAPETPAAPAEGSSADQPKAA